MLVVVTAVMLMLILIIVIIVRSSRVTRGARVTASGVISGIRVGHFSFLKYNGLNLNRTDVDKAKNTVERKEHKTVV